MRKQLVTIIHPDLGNLCKVNMSAMISCVEIKVNFGY
jgi:hypothetical protein